LEKYFKRVDFYMKNHRLWRGS